MSRMGQSEETHYISTCTEKSNSNNHCHCTDHTKHQHDSLVQSQPYLSKQSQHSSKTRWQQISAWSAQRSYNAHSRHNSKAWSQQSCTARWQQNSTRRSHHNYSKLCSQHTFSKARSGHNSTLGPLQSSTAQSQPNSALCSKHYSKAGSRHKSTAGSRHNSRTRWRKNSTPRSRHHSSELSRYDFAMQSLHKTLAELHNCLKIREDTCELYDHVDVDKQCILNKEQEPLTCLQESYGSNGHLRIQLDKVPVQETGYLDNIANQSEDFLEKSSMSSSCQQNGDALKTEILVNHQSKSECINKLCCATDETTNLFCVQDFIMALSDCEKSKITCDDKGDTDTKNEIEIGKYSKAYLSKIVADPGLDFIERNVIYTVFPVSGEIVTTQQQERNISSNMSRFEPLQTIINKIANGETVPPQISMRYEMLRFCTLRSFPKEDKPFITRIAEAGFYYANSGDEVICYCCAKRKRSWRENDNPMDVHRQMNPTCSFLTRNAEVNVPIKNNTESSTEESNSNTGNSTSRRHFESSPRSSSQNRIESTTVNNTSVPQSSPLSGANRVLTVAVDASAPRSVPATGPQSIVTGIPAALAATSVSSLRRGNQSNSILSVDVPQSRSENQPTTLHSGGGNASSSTRPKYPKYENMAARLASFTDCRDLVITSDKLADAGFFYASFGDCVRCFQCGLGLRHWSAEDDPWIEHSRWSKDCTYVRQIKGSEFVRIVQMAVEYNQHNSENEATSSQDHEGAVGGQTGEQSSEQTDNLMHTDAAQSVLEMGYDPDIIRRAIRMINPTADGEKLNAVKLMEKVFEIEESESQGSAVASEPETVPNEHQVIVKTSTIESKTSTSETSQGLSAHLGHSNNTGAVGSDTPGDSHAVNTKDKAKTTTDARDECTSEKSQHSGDAEAKSRIIAKMSSQSNDLNSLPIRSCPPSIGRESITSRKTHLLEQRRLKEENKKLKQQSICTKCKKNDVSIVFLPCGHLVTCDVCAPTVRYCTVDSCGKYIKGTVRTYLA